MKKFSIIAGSMFAAPALVLGATITDLNSIFGFIKSVLDAVLPLIIAAAVVYFVWGMFQLFTAEDTEKKDKARSTIIYGVIAIFVMISVWGLVNILVRTFGLTNTPVNVTNPINNIPGIPSGTGL